MMIRRSGAILLLTFSCAHCLPAQVPVIAAGGVVSAASWSSTASPGQVVAIFGTNLAAGGFQSASPPLPFTLGGTKVTIGGVSAPILFVSPGQVDVQVPSSLPAGSNSILGSPVVVTTPAGASTPVNVELTATAPGFFTADGSGCGQAAALNAKADGTISVNTPSNAAAPGDFVALFGTGFGLAAQQPPDGTALASGVSLRTAPAVNLDGKSVASLSYAGLAPSFAAVDQVNFQIPPGTRNGCSVPVTTLGFPASPAVTISVAGGGGQCADPPIQSSGQLALSRSVYQVANSLLGPGLSSSESFTGSFPAGPGLQPNAPEPIVRAPAWAAGNEPILTAGFISSDVPFTDPRSCAVPGSAQLSAGAIQILPPIGDSFAVRPYAVPSAGVSYGAILPAGFIQPGAYSISGAPGSQVAFSANFFVGSPIQLQTAFAPGSTISSSVPLTVKWTGGDAGTLVRVSLRTEAGSVYSYADTASGSLTIPPLCLGAVCSFGLPGSTNAQVTVQVVPAPEHVTTVSASGVTGPVQIKWSYTYGFSNLTLGP